MSTSISSGCSVEMALREMLFSSVRCRDFVCSSRNSRAFSMAMLASLASTRRISRWPSSNEALLRTAYRHHPDRPVVDHQRYAAERARLPLRLHAQLANRLLEVLANQQRPGSPQNVFAHVAAHRPRALGQTNAIGDFQLKAQFLARGIVQAPRKNWWC